MHVAKHANTKHISIMKLGIAIALLAACGPLLLQMLCVGHNEGQISDKSKELGKKKTNEQTPKMVCFASTHAHARSQGLQDIDLGTKFRFHNFIAMPFDMEVTSQSGNSIPWPDIMKTYDENLAHNVRKQKITEKMRAVFRPLLTSAQDMCSNTPVALCFSARRKRSLLYSLALWSTKKEPIVAKGLCKDCGNGRQLQAQNQQIIYLTQRSEPPKRGRKIGAAQKLSKKCPKIFWRFLTLFAQRERSRKHFDFFWRGPFPLAPFAVRWKETTSLCRLFLPR